MESWYDDYEEPNSPLHDKIYECKDIVKDIVRKLYGVNELNIDDLESDLGELCHVLEIKLPCNPLQIERTKQPMPAFLNDWLDFNKSYLQAIAK